MKIKKNIDPNSPEFLDVLEEALKEKKSISIDPDKTGIMPESKILESGEDYLEKRRLTDKARQEPFGKRFYGNEPLTEDKMKKLKMGKYSQPLQMTDELNIRPPGSEVSKYVTKQQAKGKLFRKLTGLLDNPVTKKLGKIAKIGGPIGAAIGIASDALGSEDLGADENAEIEKMKQEAIQKRRNPEESAKLDEIKSKLANMANKPLSPQDLLQNTTRPMIKELGGPADINPRMAEKLLGEQDSPDYESGIDPRMEIARRKKRLGY